MRHEGSQPSTTMRREQGGIPATTKNNKEVLYYTSNHDWWGIPIVDKAVLAHLDIVPIMASQKSWKFRHEPNIDHMYEPYYVVVQFWALTMHWRKIKPTILQNLYLWKKYAKYLAKTKNTSNFADNLERVSSYLCRSAQTPAYIWVVIRSVVYIGYIEIYWIHGLYWAMYITYVWWITWNYTWI